MTDMTTLSPCTPLFRAVRAFWLTLLFLTGFSLMGIGLDAYAQDGISYSIKLLPDGITYQVSMKPNVTITEEFQRQTNSAQVTILAAPNALSMVVNTASFTALNGTNWNLQIVRNPTVPVSPGSSSTMLAGSDYFIVGLTNNGVSIPYTAGVETPLFQFKNLLDCAGPLKIWETSDRFVPNPPTQPINVGNDLTVYGIDFATSNAWLGNYDLGLADCSSLTVLPTVALASPPAGTTVSGPTVPVSGTATPGSSVTIGENGLMLCSATATVGGSFSCLIPLSDGPHTLTAVAQDPNGISDPSLPTTFTVYTPVVPVPPMVGVTTPGTAGTTTTTPTLSGTVSPNAEVVLTGPGPVTLCSTTATANGTWSCTLGPLPVGPKSVTVIAYKGGLPSIPSVVDLIIAAAPTVVIISPANNTTQPVGTSVVSGTATPGSLVDLSDGRGPLCSTTATLSGTWSCSGLSFPVGVYSLTALAQNQGGSSPAVSSFSVVVPTSPSNSTCLVEYKIALQPDGKTYRVSMRTNVNYSNPNDVVNSAQVTVIAPHGSLRPVSVTSITGTWAYNTTIVSPTENPGSDYFIFGLTSNGVSMPFVNGLETPLFDFVTTGDCTGGLALMEANDPFKVPNSQNINAGNEITVFGYQVDADGNNLPDNAWCANYDLGQAACQTLPTVAIVSPVANSTTTTTPTISGTTTPLASVTVLGPNNQICETTASVSGTYACSSLTFAVGPNSVTVIAKNASGTSLPAVSTFIVLPTQPVLVSVPVRAFLQGALTRPGSITASLMRDDLRRKGLIPVTEPYTGFNYVHVGGGSSMSIANPSAVFSVTGANAIIDWVMVELRSPVAPYAVVASTPGLIQADGDIVQTDGISAVTFDQSTLGGTLYQVSVHHRNHLGVMTAVPISLTGTIPVVDFTSTNTAVYRLPSGDLKTHSVAMAVERGLPALWAGNTNGDQSVILQGPDNDIDLIFFDVVDHAQNTAGLTNYIRSDVYLNSDVDMNGKLIFQGEDNEVDILFFEIILHPDNEIGQFINFIIWQQLPQN